MNFRNDRSGGRFLEMVETVEGARLTPSIRDRELPRECLEGGVDERAIGILHP
jgi:hypothetical protein